MKLWLRLIPALLLTTVVLLPSTVSAAPASAPIKTVNGVGHVTVAGHFPAFFSFEVKSRAGGSAQGRLSFTEWRMGPGVGNNQALESIEFLVGTVSGGSIVQNHQLTFHGKAVVNGVAGYTFVASVMANARLGKSDRFGLWVTGPKHGTSEKLSFAPHTVHNGGLALLAR